MTQYSGPEFDMAHRQFGGAQTRDYVGVLIVGHMPGLGAWVVRQFLALTIMKFLGHIRAVPLDL